MLIPLPYFFLSFLFFLPDIHCSCLDHYICGDINISFPFIPDVTAQPSNANSTAADACKGNYLVHCADGSNPTIELDGRVFAVKNISYDNKVLTVQDDTLSKYFSTVNCGFLELLIYPADHFHLPNDSQLQNISQYVPDCTYGAQSFFQNFIARPYESGNCIPHVHYSWDERKEELHKSAYRADCLSQQGAMFEWVLSFGEDDGSLSLQSAGFSQNFELREDCFNCQKWPWEEKRCSRNNGPIDSSCYCANDCKSNSVLPSKGRCRAGKYIGIGAGVVGALVLGCISVIIYKRRKRLQQSGSSNLLSRSISSKISSKNDTELGASNCHSHIFSYDELEEATNGFNTSEELGGGGFGTVYKGKLKDGRTVAVKRLYKHKYRRLEQFMNEVEILSRLRHQNLVTLYGCTSRHSRELLLVYEYIPNGTVADHLHGSKCTLPWPVRMSISIETADALAYLHAVEPQVIHRDVKMSNILLDNNYHVKVADFGLSRLFPLDVTHASTAPQGTPGYVDPEYCQCYQLTDKSDVYSFGVVLVELISSKPAVDISRRRNEINLANLAFTKIQKCKIHELVDPELGYDEDLEVKRMIEQVAEVAFRCLQLDSEMRPSIREVLEMLRGIVGGGSMAEKEGEGNEAQTKEESQLLKNVLPFSPDMVAESWQSRSTTSSTST